MSKTFNLLVPNGVFSFLCRPALAGVTTLLITFGPIPARAGEPLAGPLPMDVTPSASGGVYAWGYGGDGELGTGMTSSSSVPVPVASPLTSGVTAVAGGAEDGFAIRNGAVYGWGYNDEGEIGNGTKTQSNAPVPVTGLSSGVTAIAGGSYHSLAIQNGVVYAWGSNDNGQLGLGTTANSALPVPVLTLSTGVTSISAGVEFSLAVKNGNVYAWGLNSYGELGNGTYTSSSVPIEIDPTDLKNITSVVAGGSASYALASDGSLWVWGGNLNGVLGLGGTQYTYPTPQHLLPPSGYAYSAIDMDANGMSVYAILSPDVVPEPSTWALLGVGAGLLGWARRHHAARV